MALTYRSPLEENVAAYDSNVQSLIASTSADYYRNAEVENFRFFNFHMSPVAKQKLITAGLYLSPYSAMPHSHPVCKTLENYFLYSVLAPLLDNRFYFIGIKDSKISLVKVRNSQLTMVAKLNRYVTSADKVRYGSDIVHRAILEGPGLKRHQACLEGATLKDLVPNLVHGKAKHIFLHDELHYWSPRDLITFLENVRPEIMYATLVYPTELLAGAAFSLHSWCYTFKVVGRDLLFYPDGVQTEGYQQPVRGGYLLETKRIITKTAVYMVDIVQSKFAHHLVCISRGEALGPTLRSFGPFEATCSTALEPLMRRHMHCIPVSYEVVSRVYRYLRTLKKPDVQSAMAKLSQLLPEPKGIEIKFIEDFSQLVIQTGTIRSMIKPETLKIFLGRWLGVLPNVVANKISAVREVSLDDFVCQMEPYTFQRKLQDVDWDYHHIWEVFSKVEEDYGVDVIKLLDESFVANGFVEFAPKTPAPYVGIQTGRKWNLLELNTDQLRKLVIHICLLECFNETMDGITLKYVQKHCTRKFQACKHFLLNVGRILGFVSDKDWMRSACNSALSRYAPKRREKFTGACRWYLSSRRSNTKYLCNYPEGRSATKEYQSAFASVTAEVLRGAKLRQTKTWTETAPTHVSAPSTNEVHVENLTSVVEEEACIVAQEEPQGMAPSICACGLALAMQSIARADLHCFAAPNQLGGHRCGWYASDGRNYNNDGVSHESQGWPRWLSVWMELNRIDAGYYNCCLYQEYAEDGWTEFHNSDELFFEKGASILICNLEGYAVFKTKCPYGVAAHTLNGSVSILMPEEFQGNHMNAVEKCSKGRASVTFRRLGAIVQVQVERAEFEAEVPPAGHSGPEYVQAPAQGYESDFSQAQEVVVHYPEVGLIEHMELKGKLAYNLVSVPGNGDCFWHCVGKASNMDAHELKRISGRIDFKNGASNARLAQQMERKVYAEEESILAAAFVLRAKLVVLVPEESQRTEFTPECEVKELIYLELKQQHFQLVVLKNACVVRAIANALNRREYEVLKVLEEAGELGEESPLLMGAGIEVAELENYFHLFGIAAMVESRGEAVLLNDTGLVAAAFKLDDNHLEFSGKNCTVDNTLLRGERASLSITNRSILYIDSIGTKLSYKADPARAKVLADCFEAGSTGVLNSRLFNAASNLFDKVQHEEEHPEEVYGVFGTFGCGKSTAFRKFFDLNPGKGVFYVSPRKALANEFKHKVLSPDTGRLSKLRKRHWAVQTFEVFLKKIHLVKPGMAVVLDEIQLYPPGYLDLVLLLCPRDVCIIVGGDPCQSDYDNEMDRPWLGSMESDCNRLLKNATYKYNVLSRRFKNKNFTKRLHCEMGSEFEFSEEHLLYTGLNEMVQIEEEFQEVFLVSSFDEKKIVSAHFNIRDEQVLTFGESTGLNFKNGTILITNVAALTSEKRWVTALSRFSQNVCFVNLLGVDWSTIAKTYMSRALGNFLCATSSTKELMNLLPGTPTLSMGFGDLVGKDEGLREEKMQGDPWLKGMIDLFQIEDVEEIEEQFEELQEEWFKTHLPREELESVRARWVHRILAKEFREVRMGYNVSEQFTDEYPRDLGKHLTNQAERFEAIYPRHRANDSVTFLMAVKKRLRFSRPAKEKAKLIEASCFGKFMLDEFLARVPLNKKHDNLLMEEAKKEFEDKKTSKSAATIENHSGRSCRDWLIDIGLIFSKSQLCTKFDNRFRVAKAAQSIVCFQHEVLCRFAPYMRYIEKKLHAALPENYYIHSGKGLDELDAWVKKGKFGGVCTESDYEAFDASQDQYMVAFEVAIMRYLGLPGDLIEDYKFIKTHLGSKLGNFAIMRFSGEASTFLFNTMANMLFTFLKYEIKGHEYICFAGDDMCASERLAAKNKHTKFLSRLKLKAKVFMVNKPTFCGWNLCPDGIYKKPQLVLERMCIAKEKNNLANCIDNYAIEVSFAYKLGERALNRMDEEEAAAFYNCVRIIIKNKHLLRSNIKELYEGNDLV